MNTYSVGDLVEKTGGDYTFVGHVVAVFSKLSGAIRYVVEDDRGVLHVYSDKVLRSTAHSPPSTKQLLHDAMDVILTEDREPKAIEAVVKRICTTLDHQYPPYTGTGLTEEDCPTCEATDAPSCDETHNKPCCRLMHGGETK